MKKLSLLLLSVWTAIILSGCSFAQTTTTVTTIPVTIDTENFIDISTPAELAAIEMNLSYRLIADIDLSGIEWTPLGTYAAPFLGILDGNGHKISNLTITVRNDMFNGLFAHMSGTIKDLELADFSIAYTAIFITYAGGLAGYLSGDIENVEVSGDIVLNNTKSNSYVGLFAGISSAKITDTMTADQFVPNQITDSSAVGTIEVDGKNFVYVGGLVGKLYNTLVNATVVDVVIDAASANYRVYAGGLTGHHYGGILIGFEEVVDSTAIPLTENLIISQIKVQASGTTASVGGFLGYSQYGVANDNIVVSEIEVGGEMIYASMLVGEAWNGSFERVVAIGSMTIVPATEDQERNISTLAGFYNEGTEFVSSYYRMLTTEIFLTTEGTEVSVANITDQVWYDTWLEWETETPIPFDEILALFSE